MSKVITFVAPLSPFLAFSAVSSHVSFFSTVVTPSLHCPAIPCKVPILPTGVALLPAPFVTRTVFGYVSVAFAIITLDALGLLTFLLGAIPGDMSWLIAVVADGFCGALFGFVAFLAAVEADLGAVLRALPGEVAVLSAIVTLL